jgi:hypothetical protein
MNRFMNSSFCDVIGRALCNALSNIKRGSCIFPSQKKEIFRDIPTQRPTATFPSGAGQRI